MSSLRSPIVISGKFMFNEKEEVSFAHEFVMTQIGLTIYHASLFTYRYRNFKNIDWKVFGFTLSESIDIVFALQNGVNISEKLKKYTMEMGVEFLRSENMKKNFLLDIKN